jgi:hypothetical protein
MAMCLTQYAVSQLDMYTFTRPNKNWKQLKVEFCYPAKACRPPYSLDICKIYNFDIINLILALALLYNDIC